ncbi:ketosteroid isomerase-like protein [Mycena galericulata]|nr:ketosteroid isomerase-like protein [Mycena galericulata]
MAPYPTKSEIREIFAPLEQGDGKGFFAHVADDVDWTVMGHHPLAGHYTSKQAFAQATLARLARIMREPLRLALENVVGGDAEEQAVVELSANGVCKNGLKFDNRYAWVLKFDGNAKIVRVHAYLDSELVKRALEENE